MADTAGSTRDRLLLAAAELLHESTNRDVSTRAICERAGVQAPTLYHFFGNKQGLLDAVVDDRFTRHMADAGESIRDSWDHHVRFGLEQPSFYLVVFGEIQPGVSCSLLATAERLLLEPLNRAARDGRLLVAPSVAAKQIVAANVGATLSLLATPGEPDLDWSARLRDTVIGAVIDAGDTARPSAGTLSTMAVGFLATLDQDGGGLTGGETALLREWLHRIARAD
jgi:AcrR family transcriptional regulator